MTWFAVSANETEATKEHYLMFIAVAFDFPSGMIRLWSGIGDLIIGADTYLGAGELARVSWSKETANLTTDRKTYQLAGEQVDPALISESDIDGSFKRSVTEYFGFLTPDLRTLLATPEVNWEGEISNIKRVDGASPAIEVNAESRYIMLDQIDGWRYTHQHQQQFYAGDLGFNQVHTVDTKQVFFGGATVSPGNPRGNPLRPGGR